MNTTHFLSDPSSLVTAGETSSTSSTAAVQTQQGLVAPAPGHANSPLITVQTVVDLLKPAVFLSWPRGTKGYRKRWGQISQAHMTPKYLSKLASGNVGVVFGDKSVDGDGAVLAGIDLDRPDFVAAFLEANPLLRETWMSRGRPDRLLVIVRIKGPCPPSRFLYHSTEKVVGDDGKEHCVQLGEWRLNGCQSIIPPSVHPDTGRAYEVMSRKQAMVIGFIEIVWPAMVGNPPTLSGTSDTLSVPIETQSNTVTHNTLLSNTELLKSVIEKRSEKALSKSVNPGSSALDYEALVLAYVVTARGHSNKALLDMARHVKRLQLGGTVVNARAVFDAWWAKSQGNVDPQYTVDEFFMKFRNALDKCRGGDLLERAWEDSVGLMAPGAEVLMDARLQHLAAFCYVLDRANGQEGFFLGCRQLAQLFELDSEYISHVAAWNRLRVLQDCRVIRLVTQGAVSAGDTGSGQANHYAYIGVRQG